VEEVKKEEVKKKKLKFSKLAEISFGTLVAINKKERTVTMDYKDDASGEWFSRTRHLDDTWGDEDIDDLLDMLGSDVKLIIVDDKVYSAK